MANNHHGPNLFVDCGSNLGQGLLEFDEMLSIFNNPNWEIHSFEANPDIDLDFRHVWNLQYSKRAVWVENTTLGFMMARRGQDYEPLCEEWDLPAKAGDLTRLGNHLQIDEIQNENIKEALEKVVQVPAFDFSEYIAHIRSQMPADKKIVVKMDIEGAEFKVVRHMLERGTAGLIDTLFIETHQHTMPDENEETTEELLNQLRECGVEVFREDHSPGGANWVIS